MKEIIKHLLTESQYSEKTEGNLSFYSNDDRSFFFIMTIEEQDFAALKNKELVKANSQYKEILDGFKAIVNSGTQAAIEKNSSLIVLVRCESIEAIEDLQQQILLFEEDEYFFKKYVILYTDESINDLAQHYNIHDLQEIVYDKKLFNRMAAEGYKDEFGEYVLVIQLFIKLPFLKLDNFEETFTSLRQRLENTLGQNLDSYYSILNNADYENINFIEEDNEERINALLSILPND